ncbi:MAG: molecular chaperone SurA [Proteobacteria bacterium]|nr:MAG: molecular chaperone SurA [Pseudomonadota bacterium]
MYRKLVRGVARTVFAACVAVVVVAPASAQVMDRVLVVVNDGVITESEFIGGMRQAVSELRIRGQKIPERRMLEEQVMEQLIIERIQLQMADRIGIAISDSQVDRAIAEIARRQGIAADQLMRRAERVGLDAERYREEIRKQLRIQRLVDREVRRRVAVSESEIDDMIATMETTGDAPAVEYEVAHISLLIDNPSDTAEHEAKLERASRIIEELQAGAEFESLARRYSDSPTADDGGYLGWRTGDKLPDLFREAVSDLGEGDVSELLDTPAGIHIVKLIGRRGGGGQLVEQWSVRHILIPVGDDTSLDEAIETAERLRERIRQGEEFAELARVHSGDAASRVKGGNLGWVSPGDTLPEFEETIRNLPLDTLSEPIETRFGVHLVEVLDRRRHDIGSDQRRLQAERALQEQKGREAYEQWLRRLRDEAYVKFRVKPG